MNLPYFHQMEVYFENLEIVPMEQIIQIYEILVLTLMVHIQLFLIHHHSVPKRNIFFMLYIIN